MSVVAEGEYEIINVKGLHARAAAQLVKAANRHKCEVAVECEGQSVNGKSIMGVLMLAAAQGMRVKVTCKGDDAQECLEEVAAIIKGRFGEAE